MPLQVLLLSDNMLMSLPKEIGKMTSLAELDASNNRLTQVPMTLGDCAGMRALDLSNNQLGLLPLRMHARARAYIQVPRKHGEQRHITPPESRRDQANSEAHLIHQQLAEPKHNPPDHDGKRDYRLSQAQAEARG
ncbi:putative leucine-rich-repeat and calponin similarity domain protein [Operophtera brumata]|uniref:Putative leucine-rich-repeat and calponin similarity domain protein n=1 Tax=Operophtera brumata TaxID=104452 RepID=A0A0L7KR39_OPEBR|nr:putative leucine-rich-repeat and calponin similarity domain protein [Operophtera brumata]